MRVDISKDPSSSMSSYIALSNVAIHTCEILPKTLDELKIKKKIKTLLRKRQVCAQTLLIGMERSYPARWLTKSYLITLVTVDFL